MSRIGIFGGTFNPPHIGHTRLAEHFVKELKLDRLLVIPTYQPPHKSADNLASGEDRINMCMLAFRDAVISPIEMNRGGKSYTYDTLAELASEDKKLFFLLPQLMFSRTPLHFLLVASIYEMQAFQQSAFRYQEA